MSFADLIAKKSSSGADEESYPESGLPQRSGSLESFIQKFGHVTEEYKFYNGEITLRFNIEEHQYHLVGELGNLIPQNGVTNTVGIIDKSHMLTPWAAKMAIQKLLRIMPTEMVEGIIRIKPLTFEEFTVIALEAKGAHKEKLDEAGDIGHMAHKCLEDSINHAILTDPEKIVRQLINIPTDEQAANAASGGFNWMCKHNVRWQETESKVYSREFEYAGTMDGLAVCDSCDDIACCPVPFKDRLSLTDWKSSNHLKIEYLFQTASYKHAKMEEHPEMVILDTWILRLGKSDEEAGKFEPWHMTPDEYEEDFQGFLACLRLTRLVDSVEARMKAQKGTIRAVKKEQRATAKALAKEQEKLQKAMDKAAAKLVKEAEKVRIKAEAKAERERLKLAKKTGVKLCELSAGSSDVITKMKSEEAGAQLATLMESVTTVLSGADLPEGIQPRADDVVFIGGAPCTSTSTMVVEDLQLDTTCQSPSEGKDNHTPPAMSSSLNPTTPVPEMPQLAAITSMVAQVPSLPVEEETSPLTYKLPME